MNDKNKEQKTASSPVVRVVRSKRNRQLAREHPHAFPEISARQQLADLEDPKLDEEE